MKRLQRTFIIVLLFFIMIYAALELTGNGHILEGLPQTYFRGLNKPDIDDLQFSQVREVKHGEGQAWPKSAHYKQDGLPKALAAKHEKYRSTAYLVIENDSLLYEQYWLDGGVDVLSNSFSMAKTFTAVAFGVAEDRGLLSAQDPAGKYLPRFKGGLNDDLTLEHLLQMSSGIEFGESYTNPFGYQAKSYFSDDLVGITQEYLVTQEPGTLWEYQGGNTVILSEILEQETGKSLSEYFSDHIWSQIGAEQTACWGLDENDGMEKAFSAFYASARDFARIGKLYLDGGRWDGKELLSERFIKASLKPCGIPDKNGDPANHYGYQWWLGEHESEEIYMCIGMRGQYIICQPAKNRIIVRLGHDRSDERIERLPEDLFWWLDYEK